MKILKTLTLGMIALGFASNAFAFITVIDVRDPMGDSVEINADGDLINELEGKSLNYLGIAAEAAQVFERLIESDPSLVAESEINHETQTVSITVKRSGYVGTEHFYYVIKKAGN